MGFPETRMRRMRLSPARRRLVRETGVAPRQLVQPLFVTEGENVREPVGSMPGVERMSVDVALAEVLELAELGLGGVLLFGVLDDSRKDEQGSAAWDAGAPVQRLLAAIREADPGIVAIADTCLCEYTSHGHCGLIDHGQVDNDRTLDLLARTAVSQAEAGADLVAPSAMIDGQVAVIRAALDEAGYQDVAIMSYAAKHASAFYGPFRDAAGSQPAEGDRRNTQMDPGNAAEAMREVELDEQEGADLILFKPGLPCLDLINEARQRTDLPIAAYQVSGEYASIRAAAANGWIDGDAAAEESLTALVRAGARIVITYFAREYAEKKRNSDAD